MLSLTFSAGCLLSFWSSFCTFWRLPLISLVFPRILLASHGVLGFPLSPPGLPRLPLASLAYLGFIGTLCFVGCLGFLVFLWLPVAPLGFLWLPWFPWRLLVFFGFPWLPLASLAFTWFPSAFLGFQGLGQIKASVSQGHGQADALARRVLKGIIRILRAL